MRPDQEPTYRASCPECNSAVDVINPRSGHKPVIVSHVRPKALESSHEVQTAFCDECDHRFPVYFQYG